MAYDDNSPHMNHPDSTPAPTNPHRVLQDIADLDAVIDEQKARRRQLVNLYQEMMVGYEKHANEVLNRPELAEAPMDSQYAYPDVAVKRGY